MTFTYKLFTDTLSLTHQMNSKGNLIRNNVFKEFNRFDFKIINPLKSQVKNRALCWIIFIKNVSESLNNHYLEYSIIIITQYKLF